MQPGGKGEYRGIEVLPYLHSSSHADNMAGRAHATFPGRIFRNLLVPHCENSRLLSSTWREGGAVQELRPDPELCNRVH
jgi:hypothetical protein